MISKAKFNRLQSLQVVMGSGASNTTLEVVDEIRAIARDLVDWVSDALVFDWLAAGFLNGRRVGDLKEIDFCVWTKYLSGSLLFSPEDQRAITKIGLANHPYPDASSVGQILTVFINGQFIADVPITEMLECETILIENVAAAVTRQTTNLLQLIISRWLILSEYRNSHDTRRLGLAFRRIWFG